MKSTTLLKTPLSLLLATFLLSGCGGIKPFVPPVTQGVVITQDQLNDLQEGLNKQQVRQLLGPTYGKSSIITDHWEYVFYSTDENQHADAIKHLILWFDEDDYLTRWEITER